MNGDIINSQHVFETTYKKLIDFEINYVQKCSLIIAGIMYDRNFRHSLF